MKSEWIEVRLSELGEIVGGATPSTKRADYYNGDIPWITPKDLAGYSGRYIKRGERNITKAGFNSCSTKIMPKNTILFSSRAPIGYIAIAENDICTNQGFKSIVPNNNINYLFLYYLLKYNKDKIESLGSGTTFKEVSGTTMKNIKVKIPVSKEIQEKIASILDCIDSKIELNQQINNNLEQQAQAIFKSWFVDFEPFKDEEFIDSELGQIPKGWQYKQIGELCKSISIKHKFDKNKLIFLNTGDIENGKFINCNLMLVSDMPGQAKKSISEGDILYSEIRPINRHFAYVSFKADDYVVSTKLMVIRAEKIDSRRLYNYLTSNNIIEELQMEAEARSGTFPQIRFDNISRLPILIADNETETKFMEILHSFYKKIEYNNIEIEKLIKIRDTLLPKLMSGEINII